MTAYRLSLQRSRRFRSPYRRRRGGAGAVAAVAIVAAVASLGAKDAPHVSRASAPAPPIATAPAGSVPGTVALGRRLAAGYGWSAGSEWACLDELWDRESGWQADIMNRQSGAFGVAQALGHGDGPASVAVVHFPDGTSATDVTVDEYPSRAANAGDAGAQIEWGLSYIRSAYGSPCGAWAHEEADSWY